MVTIISLSLLVSLQGSIEAAPMLDTSHVQFRTENKTPKTE